MKDFSGGSGGNAAAVAEIQGLYGPFSFPEKLLQQIWQRGDFDMHAARTTDGRVVEVLQPGRWNLLGGPDFKGARLRIGGVLMTGDVEMHLRAADWRAHGHAADAAYANVVLHVVLFPGADQLTSGVGGRAIPVLSLLPLLRHDLEEYAADAAVERLANHPLARADEALAAMSLADLRAELARHAEARWEQKVRYARIRVERLGWESACHHTALEILGYRANRAPMLALATAFPLESWRKAASIKTEDSTAAWLSEVVGGAESANRWETQGVRPANHPKTRLGQYLRWIEAVPAWPEQLAAMARSVGAEPGSAAQHAPTADVRKQWGFNQWRERFSEQCCGGAIGGPRLDTLACDGFWPLLAALEPARAVEFAVYWRHWFSGDVPDKWTKLLRGLGAVGGRAWPLSHGAVQGLLGWLLSEEKKQNSGSSREGRGT